MTDKDSWSYDLCDATILRWSGSYYEVLKIKNVE